MSFFNFHINGRGFFLYGLSFILLIEWLFPLPYITDTGFITLFMIATLIFFVLNFLKVHPIFMIFVKVSVILYGLHSMFFDGDFFSAEWFAVFLDDLLQNIVFIVDGQMLYLTDLFRSLLFFILLAVMSYLLYYWTVRVKRILFFFIFTVIYITVIDTFTPYDATYSIIRIFIVGFLLLGLVRIYRTMEESQVSIQSKWLPARLMLSLTFVILFASMFGFVGPKFEPQWADPVPFMKAAVGIDGHGNNQKIGYGENDEQLGGGFEDDDTPIFYAYTKKGHYWRGETKNYYTGKGWEVSTPNELLSLPFPTFEYEVELEAMEASILMTGNQQFSQIFYPGELFDVKVSLSHAISVMVNPYTMKAMPFYSGTSVHLEDYTLQYYEPTFSVTKLRDMESGGEDPEYIREHYLQLPVGLPNRVQELTEDIIAGYDNRFDQAKAVERYFSRAGFRYETKDVAIPSFNEDYVDQFLFETRLGYCDNFSTSMAVMLRSVGIPTRWVKGFTQGERLSTVDGIHEYLITSANAHSWVEVYFPHHGWVPFEPTRGFTDSFSFYNDEPNSNDLQWEREEQEQNEQEEAIPAMTDIKEDQEKKEEVRKTFSYTVPLILIVVLLLMIIVFYYRKKIHSKINMKRIQIDFREGSFEASYDRVLRLLENEGFVRGEGETLREFSSRVDQHYSTSQMSELTKIYEQYSYGTTNKLAFLEDERKLLENLINKIRS